MLEKPELKKDGKEGQNERISAFGAGAIKKELALPDRRRAGGFMMATLVAMGLAMGSFSQAEAQGGYRRGGGSSGQSIARGIENQLIFGAEMGILRKKSESQNRQLRKYMEQKRELDTRELRLGQEYMKLRQQYFQEKNQEALRELEVKYRTEKRKFAVARQQLDRKFQLGQTLPDKWDMLEGALNGIGQRW